jgi:hypothetical protein
MEWNLLSAPGGEAEFLARELRAALDELESVLTPDGCLPLLGPEARLAQDELADLAALAAVALESPAWKSVAGKFGVLPYLYLGEAGKMRFAGLDDVDWTSQDTLPAGAEILRMAGLRGSGLAISARLPASPEEHNDFTSYELTLNNHRVVVDSGCFAPEESEYFPRARAHNILLVDGREPRRRSTEDVPNVDFREISDGGARLRMAIPESLFPGFQYERAWFRMENNTWAILDWLDGQGVHSCASMIHFYPTFEIIAQGDRSLVRSRAVRFAVIPIGNAKPLASVSRGDHPQFPSWYSPEFGVKFPNAALALTWTRVELPWVGGVLITRDADKPFAPVEAVPGEGRVRLEFSGKAYDLRLR